MSEHQSMLKALRESVESIIAAPVAERAELLNKSFGQFEESLDEHIANELEAAFSAGQRGDVRKFIGSDDEELKKAAIGQVAEMASLMRSVEMAIKSMQSYYNEQLSPIVKTALDDWVTLGKGVLRAMTNEYAMGAGAAAAPAGEEEAVKAEAAADLKKAHAEIAKTAARLRKAAAEMAEAAADAPANTDGNADIENMNPLEIIGRLAAAILVQVDALMPEEEQPQQQPPAAEAPSKEDEEEANKSVRARNLRKESVMTSDDHPEHKDGVSLSDAGVTDTDVNPDKAADEDEDEEQKRKQAERGEEMTGDVSAADKTSESGGSESSVSPDNSGESADKSHGSGDLAKRLARIERENAELRQRLEKLGRGPAPAKGAAKAVVVSKKQEDTLGKGDVDLVAEAERLAKLDERSRAVELVKLAHARPLIVG